MIALWLAAGLLAGQAEAPALVVRRGDDGGGARERFWKAKAEEWLEEQLDAIQGAAGRPQRARTRLATRIVGEVPAFVSELPEMAPRVDAVTALAERLKAPQPDYSALAAAVERQMEMVAAWNTLQRRRRDMDAILVLAA